MTTQALKGQVALVTGAAKRIGREIALALAAEGADVVVHYNESERQAHEVCELASLHAVKAIPLQADLGSQQNCERLIGRAIEAMGRLDIVINNASIFPKDTLATLTFESLMRNLQLNTWAPFTLARSFAQRSPKGMIVNLLDSRLAGFDWSHTGYIVSKHALSLLTKMMAVEYAPDIMVNAVAPGLIAPPPGQNHEYLKRMADTVPLKRHGSTADIAEAVLYLVKAKFVTGTTLYIDGGRHLVEYVENSDG